MPALVTPTGPLPFELNDMDRWILSQTDDECHLHTWDELKRIIAENNLGVLLRKPSDLARYLTWSSQTKAAFGSITNFICQKRLHWEAVPASSTKVGPVFAYKSPIPFENSDDYRILRNDWPYGFTPDITHLLVWLKNRIPVDETTGDLTPESRHRIQDFVDKTFVDGLRQTGHAEDSVLWFKNWAQLQSVRGMEHIHVLVRNVPDQIVSQWTEEPMAKGSLDGSAWNAPGCLPSMRQSKHTRTPFWADAIAAAKQVAGIIFGCKRPTSSS